MHMSVKSLGKLDALVREGGKNNDDGWGWSTRAGDELRPTLPTRRLPWRWWKRR